MEAGIHIEVNSGVLAELPKHPEVLRIAEITPQPISVVTLYPGISPDVIKNMAAAPVRALIIKSYGVGNAPQDPQILAALTDAAKRGTVILNCTQCFKGKVNMGGYATGHALALCGVSSGHDMTLEAALTKLHYLLSQPLTSEQIRVKIEQNLRGELSV